MTTFVAMKSPVYLADSEVTAACLVPSFWSTALDDNFMLIYKIHPAIGVARVGNSPTAFFIGPEKPGMPDVETENLSHASNLEASDGRLD